MGQSVIAYKTGGDCRVDRLVNRNIRTHIVCYLAGFSCLFLLLLHADSKTCLVHGKALFL